MGTIHLSWWELQEFIRHECVDARSAFFRQLFPDAELPETMLTRHVAQATADMRSLQALQMFDEVPEDFGFMRFPQPGDERAVEPPQELIAAEDGARAVAAELRG